MALLAMERLIRSWRRLVFLFHQMDKDLTEEMRPALITFLAAIYLGIIQQSLAALRPVK